MNPASINPFTLPSIALADKTALPQLPAVYFALNEGKVLYIGIASNLKARWRSHHKIRQLKEASPSIRIAWSHCSDLKLLETIEDALIESFKPPLNHDPSERRIYAGNPSTSHNIRCKLQDLLNEAGLNYQAAAIATGVDPGTIRRYAKNQFDRIDCNTADALCQYFKKDLGELFFVVPNSEVEQ